MKFLNDKLLTVTFLISVSILFTGCSQLEYVENKIYSEEVVLDENYDTNDEEVRNYISREEAIEKSISLLNEGLKLNLDRSSLYESIKLDKIDRSFVWSIIFIEENEKFIKNYYININSNTGEVMAIFVDNPKNINIETDEEQNITESELNEIMSPLIKILDININEYDNFVSSNDTDIIVTLLNKNNSKKAILFHIGKGSKKLTLYETYY